MVSYDEHLGFLVKQTRGARAEQQGFLDARSFPEWTKPVEFSAEPYEQQRYNTGFIDGRTMLLCEQHDRAKEGGS